jgi:adenosylcobinamide-GDP ribazoletransferase
VQAWLLAGLNLWLTRGLHWDGWADLWDAWGSGTQGTRFWEVVKDSHTGAFGAIALVMGLGGQIVLLHHALAAHALGTIVFAAVLGRCAAAVLAFLAKSHARQGLGQAFLRQATPQRLAAALALTLALGLLLVPGATLALSLALTTLALLALLRLAREQQGCNGDFLGAAITTAELATLLGFALAG